MSQALHDINGQARANDMSYGQYVALLPRVPQEPKSAKTPVPGARRYAGPKNFHAKQCDICGDTFAPTNNRQLPCCMECREVRLARKHAERDARRRDRLRAARGVSA